MKREKEMFAAMLALTLMLAAAGAWSGPRLLKSETVPGEPVVEDTLTGLIWQGCSAGQSGSDCTVDSAGEYKWQEALDYCDALVWGGHDDWVLPGFKQLLSIRDDRLYDPMINQTFFPQTERFYWSALSTSSETAWSVEFTGGEGFLDDKDDPSYPKHVRCVRRAP